MIGTIIVALVGKKSVIHSGFYRELVNCGFEVRQSVEHYSQLSHKCNNYDLVIIMDTRTGSNKTMEIEAVHRRFPTLKIVVLGEYFDQEIVISAFAAGAHGYLVKDMLLAPMIGSLRLIAAGEKVMPSQLIDALASRNPTAPNEHARGAIERAHLSHRENEILECLALGLPNKAISRQLAISEATVKVHVKAVLRKLHVHNRTQAAILVTTGEHEDPVAGGPAGSSLDHAATIRRPSRDT